MTLLVHLMHALIARRAYARLPIITNMLTSQRLALIPHVGVERVRWDPGGPSPALLSIVSTWFDYLR